MAKNKNEFTVKDVGFNALFTQNPGGTVVANIPGDVVASSYTNNKQVSGYSSDQCQLFVSTAVTAPISCWVTSVCATNNVFAGITCDTTLPYMLVRDGGTYTSIVVHLSTQLGDCFDFNTAGDTVTMKMSGYCLSGAYPLVSSFSVTNPYTTVAFAMTAVNVPFGNQKCHDEQRRKRVLGYF